MVSNPINSTKHSSKKVKLYTQIEDMISKINPLGSSIPSDQYIVCSLHDILTSLKDNASQRKINFLKDLQDQLASFIEKNGKDPTTLYLKKDDYKFLSEICNSKLGNGFKKSELPITFFN